jgi:hypothetical protein
MLQAIEQTPSLWGRQYNDAPLNELHGFTPKHEDHSAPTLDGLDQPFNLDCLEETMWQAAESVPSFWGRQSNQPPVSELQGFTTDHGGQPLQGRHVESCKGRKSSLGSAVPRSFWSNSTMEPLEVLDRADDASSVSDMETSASHVLDLESTPQLELSEGNYDHFEEAMWQAVECVRCPWERQSNQPPVDELHDFDSARTTPTSQEEKLEPRTGSSGWFSETNSTVENLDVFDQDEDASWASETSAEYPPRFAPPPAPRLRPAPALNTEPMPELELPPSELDTLDESMEEAMSQMFWGRQYNRPPVGELQGFTTDGDVARDHMMKEVESRIGNKLSFPRFDRRMGQVHSPCALSNGPTSNGYVSRVQMAAYASSNGYKNSFDFASAGSAMTCFTQEPLDDFDSDDDDTSSVSDVEIFKDRQWTGSTFASVVESTCV